MYSIDLNNQGAFLPQTSVMSWGFMVYVSLMMLLRAQIPPIVCGILFQQGLHPHVHKTAAE